VRIVSRPALAVLLLCVLLVPGLALAGVATPLSGEPVAPTVVPAPGMALMSLDALGVSSLVASCAASGVDLVATIAIGNPRNGVRMQVVMMLDTSAHSPAWVVLNASQATYTVTFPIPFNARVDYNATRVRILDAISSPGDEPVDTIPDLPITSNDVSLEWRDGAPGSVTTCVGTAPPTATVQPTVVPSPTATVQPTVVPSPTPTLSDTPTATTNPTATLDPTPTPTLAPTASVTPVPTATATTSSPGATRTLNRFAADCITGRSEVNGAITIPDARFGDRVDLALRDGDRVLASDSVYLDYTVDIHPFSFNLPVPYDTNVRSVSVTIEAGVDGTGSPLAFAGVAAVAGPFPVTFSGDATVCGLPPTPTPTVAPSPTPTPVTPSPTSTTAPTSTPTASPTQTVPPTPTVPPPTPTTVPRVTGTVSNTGGASLRCRSGPGSTYAIIALLGPGTVVDVRGQAESGWVPVRCANRDGWVSASYLTVVSAPAPTSTPTPTSTATSTPVNGMTGTVVNTGGASLRCRAQPNTAAAVITALAAGTRVPVTGAIVGGWWPVRCNSRDGWVSGTYLSVSGTPGTPAPTMVPTATAPASTFGTVSNTGGLSLRCRTGPGTSYATITLLGAGTRVEVRGTASGGWVPVTCGGRGGWVSATYLRLDTATLPGLASKGVADRLGFDASHSRTYHR